MTGLSVPPSLPSSSGLQFHRVAEILVTFGLSRAGQLGSGYRVSADTVLTAAHVVNGASRIQVRFEADQPGEWSADVIDILEVPQIDVALLTISPRGGEELVPCLFGRIGNLDAVIPCSAVGFPLWKLREAPGPVVVGDLGTPVT